MWNSSSSFVTMDLTPGSSTAALTLEFSNLSDNKTFVTSIYLTNEGQSNTTIFPNIDQFEFIYHGSPVSAANPLPVNQTATGSIHAVNVVAGTTYNMKEVIVYQNGFRAIQLLYVSA